MKKIIAIVLLLMCPTLYSMNLDELGNRHIQILRQKYPNLSPIGSGNTEGHIVAFYSSLEEKTRTYIAYKDGTYEYVLLHKNDEPKVINPRCAHHILALNKAAYDGMLDYYNNRSTTSVKLPLGDSN